MSPEDMFVLRFVRLMSHVRFYRAFLVARLRRKVAGNTAQLSSIRKQSCATGKISRNTPCHQGRPQDFG